ncbi:MAG TPA: enoyl-CoA hydratase/isomerase family protein [Phycisphaerales bacterium]|nr:enoyl-CoA hydratase/isomerase family protein [Phycisphaerales bacterium]
MINVRVEDGVGIITLARGEKRNAMTPGMLDEVLAAVEAMSRDEAVRVMMVTGEGEMFCAGFDLTLCKDDATVLPALLTGLAKVVSAMRASDKAVVMSAHGGAIAGGCAMLCGGDVVVTTDEAKIGYPVLRLGISPAVSGPALRLAVGDGAARARMLDTGLVSGRRAVELGLAHASEATRDACEQRAFARAKELASKPAHAMAATKRWLREVSGADASAAGLATSLSLVDGAEQAAMLPAAWQRK